MRAIQIPQDTLKPLRLIEVPNRWQSIAEYVGVEGEESYIEVVHPVGMQPGVVMIVDEEGLIKNQKPNRRASLLYPQGERMFIRGDALLLGEHRQTHEFCSLKMSITLIKVSDATRL